MRLTWPTRGNTSTKKGRVFVGLSGGVDSAVSAALLQREGYEVTGVFIRIALEGYPCTAGVDKLDAMRVAAHLKIPFLSIDLSAAYKKRVFELSIAEFSKGRTPNPDALCNREIKFGLFFDWCMSQGADLVATGHYAQTRNGELYKGADPEKDQSYFLWAVPEEALRKTLFPVGHLKKPQVRKLALKYNLPNAQRKDSQGLCFLGPVSLDDMLHREIHLLPGDVLNERGEVVGRHEGVQAYTLGQRHGFSLHAQQPDTVPHYVIEKDVAFNTITVSPDKYPKGVAQTEVALADENWLGTVEDGDCAARFRYRQTLIPAALSRGSSSVLLKAPYYVPEGQSLVIYRGERCLGGGIVDKSALR